MAVMQVRLTRKLANLINGVNLSGAQVGDVLTVPLREGQLLIAEGWAVPHERSTATRGIQSGSGTTRTERALAADKPKRKLKGRR